MRPSICPFWLGVEARVLLSHTQDQGVLELLIVHSMLAKT